MSPLRFCEILLGQVYADCGNLAEASERRLSSMGCSASFLGLALQAISGLLMPGVYRSSRDHFALHQFLCHGPCQVVELLC